jgi:16S rRNA (cytidine1402-2'-O)-methyltransferase
MSAPWHAAADALDPGRPVAVCRELTKRHEEVARGSAAELATQFTEPPRGEITIVIGATATPRPAQSPELAFEAVARLVASGATRRTAAEVIASLTGLPRKKLYDASL